MELTIFARFHARAGRERELATVLREQAGPVRDEPGRLEIGAYGSTGNPGLFYIHSRWRDEAAFEIHAALPRTVEFVAKTEALIDHPFEATRATRLV